ncbi:carboxypeptidase-like regulatory domain-containing protein [uncultured Acetobacteroides sp.]|uniref:carboxypeptidase-like regulatory domain-containing protein n=1 Tax=uncultured Acetobacteroides sp. TaxID=1760811 RepID=UPI0029F49193|nr:carboxypeptidase-like regulatory domain-containing protein [uncultured Acetobacteroides sp.]
MTNPQENSYEMQITIRDFLGNKKTITDLLPNFGPLYTQYCGNLLQIGLIKEKKSASTAGVSEKKEKIKTSLINKTFDIANKTMVFAKMVENPVLANEVKCTESILSHIKDGKLIDRANLIYSRASANLEPLKEYGVTADGLKELKSAIGLMETTIPSTRIERNEAVALTQQLKALFSANEAILEKIDLLMQLVRLSHPEFYTGYKSNRKLPSKKSTTLSLTAKVTSAVNGEPLKGARIVLTPVAKPGIATAAKSSKPVEKKTATKGMLRIKNLPEGVYQVTIEKAGFATVTQTVSITDGKMTTLHIKMEKE